MTISYSGNFCRLLFRWKGSLWRLVWKELFFYLVLFYTIHLSYVFGIDYMGYYYRNKFEQLCSTFDQYAKMIPLTFLLGFYVSTVVTRWWRQFECLSWPEDILSILCTVIHRTDETSQKRRHTIARYLNLSTALAWRDISSKIRMRFPTVESLVSAGLLTQNEYDILEKNNDECEALRWMTPLHWIQQIMKKEEEENKPTTSLLNNFMTELKILRQSLRKLYCYDWVCVPLVYTQVAALATYAFFFFSLFARQNTSDNRLDMLLPVFTIVQFLFYVGWFKVGQDLMRPFGLDDDDIELNYILDRNIATSFALVNRLQNMPLPEEEEDYFWKNRDCHIGPLPHTEHSSQLKEHRPKLLSYVNVGSDDDANINCMEPHRDKKHINW